MLLGSLGEAFVRYERRKRSSGTGKVGDGRGSSPGEWALGVLGGLGTLSLLGFFAYQSLAVRQGDPRLVVEVSAVEQTPRGYVAELRVRNHGGGTAQGVHVVGTVTVGGRPASEASATIDYVPPNSSGEAALVFRGESEHRKSRRPGRRLHAAVRFQPA